MKEKLKAFLSTYKGQKDLAHGISDLDIGDDNSPLNGYKYMSQLVSQSIHEGNRS